MTRWWRRVLGAVARGGAGGMIGLAGAVAPVVAAGATSAPVAVAAPAASVPTPATRDGDVLRIGSKRFTESYLLAHLLAEAARPHARVDVRAGLGNTAIVWEALKAGSIDLYPEYTGTLARELLHDPQATTLPALRQRLAPLGFGVALPLGFNDGYALAMREAQAQRLGVRTLGDLARQPGLRLGLSHEFLGRADGWPGLAAAYGLPQHPVGLDHGLSYDALSGGQVDAIDIYTTDARIAPLGLRVLVDDRAFFPRYDAVVLYRLDVPARFSAAWAALQRLAGHVDERAMIAMNARAEIDGAAFEVVARDQLGMLAAPATASATAAASSAQAADVPPRVSSPTWWQRLVGPDLGRLTLQHLGLVAVAVALSAAIGIPLAVVVSPHARASALLLAATGLLQTVPSLAMLAALISLMGRIGTGPALVALTLYALLPVMRNTCTGLAQVPRGLRDSAMALGLTRAQRLWLVELPLARPVLLAGVRTATTISVGTATLAAFIGAGGYGERIVTGLALNDRGLMLAGAVPAAALALACEALFAVLERRYGARAARGRA